MCVNQSELIVGGISVSDCHKLEQNISESERGDSKDLMEGQQIARLDSPAILALHTCFFFFSLVFISHRYSKSINFIL